MAWKIHRSAVGMSVNEQDGVIVRWWCDYCHGRNPKPHRLKPRGVYYLPKNLPPDERMGWVVERWTEHHASTIHQREAELADLVGRIADHFAP